MFLIFIVFIFLMNFIQYNAKLTHLPRKYQPQTFEIDIKKKIEEYCIGKSQDFCSVEHLLMIHKLIEEKERKIRMKLMKENILKEIIQNIRGVKQKHIKDKIVKDLIKSIQE